MLYIAFAQGAFARWQGLLGWERERIAEAIISLSAFPRPRAARRRRDLPGEQYELWAGDRRLLYRIFKDDLNRDLFVVVYRVT